MLHNSRTGFLVTREQPRSSIKKQQQEEVPAHPVKTKSQEKVPANPVEAKSQEEVFNDFLKEQTKNGEYRFNSLKRENNVFSNDNGSAALSDAKVTEDLKKFAKEMAEFADAESFFAVFNELIAHQVRIIQYYRLFKHFDGLNMLDENDKKWFEANKGEIQKALAFHDSDKLGDDESDKLGDKTVMKAYLVQKYIRSFIKTPDGKKFLEDHREINEKIINKLAGVLRRTHSDTSKHHDEYYIYRSNKNELPDKNKAFEFIFDIMAIGDKKNEIIGEYYKEKHETSFRHFGNYHELIEKVFDFFKYQKGFREIEKEKLVEQNKANEKQIEDLKKQAGTSDKIQELEEKIKSNKKQIEELEKQIEQNKEETQQGSMGIAKNIEDVVWQEITSDDYGKNIELLKAVSENMLYKATEEWQQGKHQGAYDIMKKIAEIKKHVFDLSKLEKKIDELYSSQVVDKKIDLANKTIDEKIDAIKKENECYEGHESFFAVYEGKKITLGKKTINRDTKKTSSVQTTSCVSML